MAKRVTIPETGVDCVLGLPGGGKSFYLVRDVLLESIVRDKRPVFHNLPIRDRVVRQYLRNRGGEACANLLHRMSEEHFKKFCKRFCDRAKFKAKFDQIVGDFHSGDEDHKRQWMRDKPGFFKEWSDGSLRPRPWQVAWEEHCVREGGPDRYIGLDANWIPATSVIIIDEVHTWFPGGMTLKDSPDLLGYLTMHRHMYHRIHVATQHWGQVNVIFRRNAAYYVRCEDVGLRNFVAGITFANVGLRHLGRYTYQGGSDDEPDENSKMMLKAETVWTGFSWNKWPFRLYSSHTHAESLQQAVRILRRERADAGLYEQAIKAPKGKSVKKRYMALLLIIGIIIGCLANLRFGKLSEPKPPEFPLKVDGWGDDYVSTDKGVIDANNSVDGYGWIGRKADGVYLSGPPGLFLCQGGKVKFLGSRRVVIAAIRSAAGKAPGQAGSVAKPGASPGKPGERR